MSTVHVSSVSPLSYRNTILNFLKYWHPFIKPQEKKKSSILNLTIQFFQNNLHSLSCCMNQCRLLARWASRRPMDGHLLKKIIYFSYAAYCIFHLSRPYSVFWTATFQILAKSLNQCLTSFSSSLLRFFPFWVLFADPESSVFLFLAWGFSASASVHNINIFLSHEWKIQTANTSTFSLLAWITLWFV